MTTLSIVIPVKNPPDLQGFITANKSLLASDAHKIIVDSGGGSRFNTARNLGFLPLLYKFRDVPFWEARRIGYEYAVTPFILNLDVDVIVPESYVEDGLALLKKEADAVSIFYENVNHCQGALEFGVSIWKAEVLRRLYDFSMNKVMDGKIVKIGSQAYSTLNNGWCECTYMWRRLKLTGAKLETLPYRAIHLKKDPPISKSDNFKIEKKGLKKGLLADG